MYSFLDFWFRILVFFLISEERIAENLSETFIHDCTHFISYLTICMPLSLDLNCCSFKTPQYVWLAAYQNAHTGLLVTYKILLLYLIIRYKICRNNHSGITYSLKLAKYLAFSTFILALHVLLYTETDSDIWHYFCRL